MRFSSSAGSCSRRNEPPKRIPGQAHIRGLQALSAAHGAGYFAVTALTAWLVFAKLGVGLLRKAWINLDRIWAAALIVTGAATLVF